jgi:hypothetical protein
VNFGHGKFRFTRAHHKVVLERPPELKKYIMKNSATERKMRERQNDYADRIELSHLNELIRTEK